MAAVTPQMVKELRERTGVGMAKCNQALKEANGDIELAISNLRKAGMASAVKKEGRETNDGSIGFYLDSDGLALIEINSETDFVAQNENFQNFLKQMAEEIYIKKPASIEEFMKDSYSKDTSHSIEEMRTSLVQSLGENIQVRRILFIPQQTGHSLGVYSHMGGKIVCAVELNGAEGQQDFAKEISMHIAAEAPEYLSPDQVPAEIIEKEKDIARDQVKNKPANIVEKILEGKMKAYFDQVCLLNQKFIKDPDTTISQLVDKRGKEIGKPLKIQQFVRWQLGS